VHVAEEMDDVLGPREQGKVALNDDAIETVVYKPEQAAKQLVKGLHRSSPLMRASATRSCARRLVETTFFDRRDRDVRSTTRFYNQGLCSWNPGDPVLCVAGALRDFKGRALGYS